MLISNLTSSWLKKIMKDFILMTENSSINVEWIEEISFNIKTFIIFLIHRVGALISDIWTCAFKRGIRVSSNSHKLHFSSIYHRGFEVIIIAYILLGERSFAKALEMQFVQVLSILCNVWQDWRKLKTAHSMHHAMTSSLKDIYWKMI